MSLGKVGGILSAGLNGINYPVTTVEYLVVAGGGGGGKDEEGEQSFHGDGCMLSFLVFCFTRGAA